MKRANARWLTAVFGLFAAATTAGNFEAIPVLVERPDGMIVPLLDERTGQPVFEINGIEYRAVSGAKRAVAPRAKSAGATEEKRKAGLLGNTLLGPVQDNAYGPDLDSDATGRPFRYRTDDGEAGQTGRLRPGRAHGSVRPPSVCRTGIESSLRLSRAELSEQKGFN